MAHYGRPEIFNTDQGSQFTSREWTGALQAAGTAISMDAQGARRLRLAKIPGVSSLDSKHHDSYLTSALLMRFLEITMSEREQLTTTVSTKGQVILPQAIRRRLRWQAGTRLVVENTREGVLLKPLPVFNETLPEQVFGSLGFHGAPKSLEEMEAGILAEAKRRHAGD